MTQDAASGMRGRSRTWQGFLALLAVGIWIPLLATLPMILGGTLWSHLGFTTDLPLRHLTQALLASSFVLAFLLLTGRGGLLVPERARRPWVFLLFLPLMLVNAARGPLTEVTLPFLLAGAADNYLVGFWEEFLFRGAIQDRLAVLGARLSLLVTAVLFGLVHANEGVPSVLIATGIGLPFCVARAQLGLWPLVFIHGTIDMMVDLFEKRWPHQFAFGASVVAIYFIASLAVLSRRRPAEAA